MRNLQPVLALALLAAFTPSAVLCAQEDTTKPAPQPGHYYRIGRGVKAPRAIDTPAAEYTERARKEHQEGVVGIQMVVGTNGLPRDIKVSRSLAPDLDQSAAQAVQKWKFSPATKDGKPVSALINVEVAFRLAK